MKPPQFALRSSGTPISAASEIGDSALRAHFDYLCAKNDFSCEAQGAVGSCLHGDCAALASSLH
jgi:hypothetical protein